MYPGDTVMKKLLAHREQPIPLLRAVRPKVPEEVAAVPTVTQAFPVPQSDGVQPVTLAMHWLVSLMQT